MNAVVAEKTSPLLARPYKLRFAADVPSEVVQLVIDRWNSELAHRFSGDLLFPPAQAASLEVMDGNRAIRVVPLLADANGWNSFRERGVSLRPVVDAALAAEERVVPMRIPALGATAHATA